MKRQLDPWIMAIALYDANVSGHCSMALLLLRYKEVPTVDLLHIPQPCHLRML